MGLGDRPYQIFAVMVDDYGLGGMMDELDNLFYSDGVVYDCPIWEYMSEEWRQIFVEEGQTDEAEQALH